MLKIFICEDEVKHLAVIKKCIENHITINNLAMHVVCAAHSPDAVLDCLSKNPGDAGLYFLDVHLNCGINGIELAEAIRKHDPRGYIVFITSDSDSHRLTFKYKVEAMDYIVKNDPSLNDHIRECIDTAMEKLTAKAAVLKDDFVFKLSDDIKRFRGDSSLAKDSTVVIDTNKILCFMTEPGLKHTVIVCTTEGRMQLYGSLGKVEGQLNPDRFYRCQSNLIINLDKFVALDPVQHMLTLEGNLTFNIALRKIKALDARVREYVESKRKP